MNAEILPLLNHALRGVLLGALAWGLVRLFVRDARHRSVAASAAIFLTVLGPLGIPMLPSWPENVRIPVMDAIHDTLETGWKVTVAQSPPPALPMPEAAAAASPPQRWYPSLTGDGLKWIWACGAVVWLLLHLAHTARVWVWSHGLRRARPSELEALPEVLRKHNLRVFDHPGSPCVAGWLRPVIAVPASAFGSLSPRQWRWIMRHEDEHLKGGDTVVLWLHECARAFAWWNPFVHLLAEVHSRSREEVCDGAALERHDETRGYSEFLLDWASQSLRSGAAGSPGVVAMASSRPVRRLKARLQALAEGRQTRRVGGWFVAVLALLALGMTAAVSLLGVSAAAAQDLVPVAESRTEGAELFTRSYQVSADFLSGFAGGVAAKNALEKKGIGFPPGASAILIETSLKLIVRNTRAAHAKIESLVAAGHRQPPQVYFRGRFIQTDHFLGKHGEVISSRDAEQMMRQMSQKKGVDLLSAPSVTSRLGQRAVAEICRENPANTRQIVGLRQAVHATAAGDGKVELQTEAEFFKEPGVPLLPPRDLDSVAWDRVKTYAVKGKAMLASGETLVLHLPLDRQSVTVLISVQAIRPDGKDAASFDESFDTAPPRKAGDEVLRPADAFNREVEQGRSAGNKLAAPRITLKMFTASFSDPKGIERSLMPDAAPNSKPGDAPSLSLNPGWSLQAVFVEEQLQKVLGRLRQDSNAALALPIQKAAASGTETVFTSDEGSKLGALKVTPVIGADGYTVDLVVELQGEAGDTPPLSPTSISIWNGQTVMFCSSPSGTGKDAKAVFLTVGWPEK